MVNNINSPKGLFKNSKICYNTNMNMFEKVQFFFKEVYVELRKTNWLSRGEVLRYTVLVLIITISVAFFLGGLDYIFSSALKSFILK